MKYDTKIWQPHFEHFEGRINHFYLDGENNVTVGIGCLVSDPAFLAVPMRKKTTSLTAIAREVRDEFDAVKTLEPKRVPDYYGRVCQLYMAEGDIDALFQLRLAQIAKEFETTIHIPADAPEDVLLAGVDMAFTLGAHGLKTKFPKFVNAYEAGDWHVCSLDCERLDVQSERNEWARQIFEQHAKLL